ncbi:hypothetical protein TKK_0015288 [Trichogramma kaykai]
MANKRPNDTSPNSLATLSSHSQSKLRAIAALHDNKKPTGLDSKPNLAMGRARNTAKESRNGVTITESELNQVKHTNKKPSKSVKLLAKKGRGTFLANNPQNSSELEPKKNSTMNHYVKMASDQSKEKQDGSDTDNVDCIIANGVNLTKHTKNVPTSNRETAPNTSGDQNDG